MILRSDSFSLLLLALPAPKGVLRIVEELREKRPNAKIVLNSLLPMTKIRSLEPLDGLEFLDADRSNGRGPHEKIRHAKDHAHQDHGGHKKKSHRKNSDINHTRRQLNRMHPHHDHSEGKQHKSRIESHIMKEKESNQRKYEKLIKKDKYNPTLHTVSHYKKHDWVYHHKNPPLWSAIQKINQELHSFCKKNKNVMFYDATELFTIGGNRAKDYTLLTDFISPRGNLTVKGYKIWLNEVGKTLQHMLVDKKMGKPFQDLSHKPKLISGASGYGDGVP